MDRKTLCVHVSGMLEVTEVMVPFEHVECKVFLGTLRWRQWIGPELSQGVRAGNANTGCQAAHSARSCR